MPVNVLNHGEIMCHVLDVYCCVENHRSISGFGDTLFHDCEQKSASLNCVVVPVGFSLLAVVPSAP
jgi:hypothetical protein